MKKLKTKINLNFILNKNSLYNTLKIIKFLLISFFRKFKLRKCIIIYKILK